MGGNKKIINTKHYWFPFSGFGHELAHHLCQLGVEVFAGCLDSEGEGAKALRTAFGDKVHVIQLDVTSDKQVAEALQYVNKHKPRRGKGQGVSLFLRPKT